MFEESYLIDSFGINFQPVNISGKIINQDSQLESFEMLDLNSILTFLVFLADRMRLMFYMVKPSETMFSSLDQVPRYVAEMFPIFVLSAAIEIGIKLIQGQPMIRLNESVASLSAGIFQECLRIKLRSFEIIMYCLVWNNLRIMTLPWDSVITWWTCYLAVDFGFYWAHRLAHEVNFIWAIHQAHHSSEEFNVVSALRQAVLQPFTAWFTYMPLALFIPPQIFLAHLQLTELYMAWLHTEVVDTFGPLEYIFNTPSNHRVHHSRNPEYVDKNYGGVLIIWDRLFNTFKREDKQNPPVYGLVHPVASFEPFYMQLHMWPGIWNRIKSARGILDKIRIFFYPPGWAPGLKYGESLPIPIIKKPLTYYDPKINNWMNFYVLAHFAIVVFFYHELSLHQSQFSPYMVNIGVVALLISITTLGLILDDRRRYKSFYELLRCLLYFATSQEISRIIDHGLERSGLSAYYRVVILSFIFNMFLWSVLMNATVLVYSLIKNETKLDLILWNKGRWKKLRSS